MGNIFRAPPVGGNRNITINGTAYSFSYVEGNTTWSGNPGNTFYTISNDKVLFTDGTIIQYNGVDVLPTDSVVVNGAYTTRANEPTTGTIKFGSAAPTKYYLGNKAVDRIYMGTVLLYKKAIVYTITANLANCTANSDNPITIEENGGAILYYTANTGYELPDGVELTNVGSYNWDKTTGKLVIARPSGNVTIKIVAKQTMTQLATPQNVSVEDTTLSFDEVENAEEYEVFVDNVSIGSYQVSKGETWLLNSEMSFTSKSEFSTNFVSNNLTCTHLSTTYSNTPMGVERQVLYTTADSQDINVYTTVTGETPQGWQNEAYRTITFDSPVTDSALLTWLQANGVKQ